MELSEVTCSLCGRTLLEATTLLGDPVTGDRLCEPCAEDWSPGHFVPSEIALGASATATIVGPGPDDHVPPLPTLRHLDQAHALNQRRTAACHEVWLLSLARYADGFEVRARVGHPDGCGRCGFPDDREYEPPDPTVTVSDDRGRVYLRDEVGVGGAGWSPDGSWTREVHVSGGPAIARDARELRVRLEFDDLAGTVWSLPFEVPLDPEPPAGPPALAARMAALAGANPPPAHPDQDEAMPDLGRLHRVVGIGRTARAAQVSVTWLFLDVHERGFRLDMFALLPDGTEERLDHAWLDAVSVHAFDDRSNRYPMRTVSGGAGLDRSEVSLSCCTPLHPGAVALRLYLPDLVWNRPGLGMFRPHDVPRPIIDLGPFDVVFPLQ